MAIECSIDHRIPGRSFMEVAASAIVFAFLVFFAFAAFVAGAGMAHADPAVVAPLHDPITDPLGAWSDLQLAAKTSWPVATFAGLTVLTKLLGYFSPKLVAVPLLGGAATWLSLARNAAIVAGVGTIALALYNVLAIGGTWTAALIAGGLAIAGILHPTAAPKSVAA